MPRIILFTLLTLIFINFPLKVKALEGYEKVDKHNLFQPNSARFHNLSVDSLKTLGITFTTYISSKSANWLGSIYQKFEVCRETVESCAKSFVLVCRKFGVYRETLRPCLVADVLTRAEEKGLLEKTESCMPENWRFGTMLGMKAEIEKNQ